MKNLQYFLEGKKTYIVAFIAVALNFAVFMNWVTVEQVNTINVILGGLGLATLRSAVSKV